jgi:nucleotide-binding universal stress UspA family protein
VRAGTGRRRHTEQVEWAGDPGRTLTGQALREDPAADHPDAGHGRGPALTAGRSTLFRSVPRADARDRSISWEVCHEDTPCHVPGGGSPRPRWFAELLTGSVGVHVTTHAHCPVLVVRGEIRPADSPVVGVDGSAPVTAATRVAFAEARARSSDLVVTLVRPPARSWSSPGPDRTDRIQATLDGIADEYSDVKLRREMRHSHSPAHALATLAEDLQAGLIVVGSRGLGGFRGLLMGGTSRALIDHSPCPLLVVRALA